MFEIDTTAQGFASLLAHKTADVAAYSIHYGSFTKYIKKFLQAIQHYVAKNSDHTLGTPSTFILGNLFSYINFDYAMAVEI